MMQCFMRALNLWRYLQKNLIKVKASNMSKKMFKKRMCYKLIQ